MIVLLPLLGLTWVFGIMAINKNTIAFQYLFAILNSLQVRRCTFFFSSFELIRLTFRKVGFALQI